jgi:hypothetical protein
MTFSCQTYLISKELVRRETAVHLSSSGIYTISSFISVSTVKILYIKMYCV